MGTGIFTRYSRQVLGTCVLILLLAAAAQMYMHLRGPAAGLSPYETVNDLPDWENMTFAAVEAVWPADTEAVELTFRNDAADGAVWLCESGPVFGYVLEVRQEDGWHSLRSAAETPRWDGETDIVDWGGGEVTLSCPVGRDYPSPLKPGQYRVVLPGCTRLGGPAKALAAEFEVR